MSVAVTLIFIDFIACLKMSLQRFNVIYVYKAYWIASEPEMCHSN